MSELSNYPDFYKPIEGQSNLSKEELVQTNQAFNELFNDLMLKDIEIVRRFDGINDHNIASLVKTIIIDGQKYTLSLQDNGQRISENETDSITFRDSEITARDISLQRLDEETYGREYWSYRLGADGIIRRFDVGDITAKKRNDKKFGIEELEKMSKIMSTEDGPLKDHAKRALSMVHAALQNMYNEMSNSRLEEDMGLNNQPVTLAEIQGLRDFLNSATDIQR